MAQPDTGSERRSAAPRIAGLAVLVVLAVVFARARAAGMNPSLQPPPGSITQVIIRIIALAVMVAAAILLLSGRIRKVVVPGAKVQLKKKKVVTKPSRRVVIAALIGLLFALGMQILGNSVNDQQKKPPPPPPSAQQQVERSKDAQERGRPQAEAESGIADKVILVVALLTLGTLIVVVARRKTELLDDDEEADDDDEVMAKAMRAARAAVLDRAITDPRSAIVACFAAMEDALADRGGAVSPQDSDTASEVLYRGIERASLPEPAALTLLRLFREARFSTHPMTEQDRGDADESLGELLRALGAPARVRTGGAG